MIAVYLYQQKWDFGNECDDKKVWNKCNNEVNENKEFEAKLNELKRYPPNEIDYMLPYYKKENGLFVINCLKNSSILTCFIEKKFLIQ